MNAHHTAHGWIAGVVAAVPDNVITNDDCPDPAAAHEAARITGVHERRWVRAGQTAEDLCGTAAARLLGALGWQPSEVDALVYVTQTPTRAVPADVYSIAASLGIKAPCVQVNWSCAGYVYGLWLLMRLLQPGQRGLLLVGDATSTICDPGDRATAPLFGDAGSATAIVGGGQEQHFFLGTDGSGADKLCQAGCVRDVPPELPGMLQMDGAAVFNYTLRAVPQLAADVRGVMPDPSFWLLHQANAFMLDHLARKCQLPYLSTPTNVHLFGNCSSASIPLLMASTPVEFPLQLQPCDIAMIGMGAGWAHGAAALRGVHLRVCELIEV